jgi:hypothetical protein
MQFEPSVFNNNNKYKNENQFPKQKFKFLHASHAAQLMQKLSVSPK